MYSNSQVLASCKSWSGSFWSICSCQWSGYQRVFLPLVILHVQVMADHPPPPPIPPSPTHHFCVFFFFLFFFTEWLEVSINTFPQHNQVLNRMYACLLLQHVFLLTSHSLQMFIGCIVLKCANSNSLFRVWLLAPSNHPQGWQSNSAIEYCFHLHVFVD